MRVPARIYADDVLLEQMLRSGALTQLANTTTLPGIVGFAFGMPDLHSGEGFPMGGVVATRHDDGVVAPGGVGHDINCGVRLIALPVSSRNIGRHLEEFVDELVRHVAAGGDHGRAPLGDDDFDRMLMDGSRYVVTERGEGNDADLAHTESGGRLDGADTARVTDGARKEAVAQFGTLGGGSHFLGIQSVDAISDPLVAAHFGLQAGQVIVLVHTGSRGLGHHVCTDHLSIMEASLAKHDIVVPDRHLACAPATSPEGRGYLAAMAAAANFAWANRQFIGHIVRMAAARVFGVRADDVVTVYDVARNIARIENHGARRIIVHRKGATRALGPGHAELPPGYAATGQPVLLPGRMGAASWVLAGVSTSAERSWSTACNGAVSFAASPERAGARSDTRSVLEAHSAVDHVASVAETAGLAKRVARLRPLGVIRS